MKYTKKDLKIWNETRKQIELNRRRELRRWNETNKWED